MVPVSPEESNHDSSLSEDGLPQVNFGIHVKFGENTRVLFRFNCFAQFSIILNHVAWWLPQVAHFISLFYFWGLNSNLCDHKMENV